MAFESEAGGGVRFHYSSLNAGGLGRPRHGLYCVVDARRPGEGKPDPVWIGRDSLSDEYFPAGSLDWERLKSDVAPCDLAAELAA